MKKYILAFTLLLGFTTLTEAQTIYDAENFMNKDLSGTARFVGMGGALGALGADISTMGTNPAGIGLYRRYDFAGSLGFSNTEYKTNFDGIKNTISKNKFNVNQLGFVISTPTFGGVLKYFNFGFNYNRVKTFNRTISVRGNLNGINNTPTSLAYLMASQANNLWDEGRGTDVASEVNNDISENRFIYDNPAIGWLSTLGYQANAIILDGAEGDYFVNPEISNSIPNMLFEQKESGKIDRYDLNLAFNLSDRVFLGMTFGIYDINYRLNSYHDEAYRDLPVDPANPGLPVNQYMLLQTYSQTKGTGYDFKLGAIIRPFESSPFRIGLAFHTPTYYKLTNYAGAIMEYQLLAENELRRNSFDTYDNYGRDASFDYKLRTPWVYNLSLGHSIGTFFSIGAEYEYQDYSSIKFKDDLGYSMTFPNSTKSMLKGVHTFRLGAEFKVVPEFAVRVGYNYQSATTKKDAYLDLPNNSIQTNAQYINNDNSKNTVTMGLGYAGKVFYTDLAFQFDFYKSSFKPYTDNMLEATKFDTNRSLVMLTFGVRI